MHGISTHAYEMCISQSFTINKCLVNEYLYFPQASSSQSIRTGDVHPTKYPSQNYGGLSLHYYFIWCRIIHLKTSAIYSAAFCNLLYQYQHYSRYQNYANDNLRPPSKKKGIATGSMLKFKVYSSFCCSGKWWKQWRVKIHRWFEIRGSPLTNAGGASSS